ncbi:hypothetical protein BGW38_006136 [Lunasporangiospora selenospora]|uniref:NADP-dependent oxidoreductase domain-containing protein n=1 Tax=Lunasporangiospora selenospora TaxID=979761 RepID=A0A9P6FZ65_9FUNG|nr:hypothetical protein BGW38_006136 [Lunasporangiospora selenospora]
MNRIDLKSIKAFRTLSNGKTIPLLGLGSYLATQGGCCEQAVLWALEHFTARSTLTKQIFSWVERVLEAVLTAGYRHIDTAAFYENEESVGAAIRKSGIPREDIFVTTKLFEDDQGYESAIKACKVSLKKLGLDYIDLYLIHAPMRGAERRKQSWKALETLHAQGIVKSIGVSNYGVAHLKEILDSDPVVRPVVNQIEIHPWLQRPELFAFCEENNIALEAYSPLTQGHKLGDADLVRIASKYSKTPAQILIRWCLQRNFIVIPKSASKERIQQNANVFDFEIEKEDMDLLNSVDENFVCEWDPTTAP